MRIFDLLQLYYKTLLRFLNIVSLNCLWCGVLKIFTEIIVEAVSATF